MTLPIEGVSSLERLLAACTDAQRVVVVGPPRDVSRPVTWCREEPQGSGPFAAVAAAVVHTEADVVLVAAGDMPLLGLAKLQLLGALESDPAAHAAVLLDADGVRQPLGAAYRRDALVRRFVEMPDPRDRPAKLLLDGLRVNDVAAAGAAADCDTWDDVYRIEEELRRAR